VGRAGKSVGRLVTSISVSVHIIGRLLVFVDPVSRESVKSREPFTLKWRC
jgi:hypothetical protein